MPEIAGGSAANPLTGAAAGASSPASRPATMPAGAPEPAEVFASQPTQDAGLIDKNITPASGAPSAEAATAATPSASTPDFDPALAAALAGNGAAGANWMKSLNALNAANQGPVKNQASPPPGAASSGPAPVGSIQTPPPPMGGSPGGPGGPGNPGGPGSGLGGPAPTPPGGGVSGPGQNGQYGTAGNTFTDVATRQKAIQDDLNQAQTIYMQMAADRYKWISTMMRIWADMRTSVLENILGATKNMLAQFEKTQDGFIQLLES